MRKQSKWTLRVLAIATSGALLFTGPSALANSLNDLKGQQKELEQKKESINSNIKETEGKINQNESKIDQIMAQIQALDTEILDTEKNISNVLNEIKLTTDEIEKLKASIVELERKIEERDKLLKERIRAVQVSGGSVSYLDVLLGANSFVDFIDRFSAVNTLMEADRTILKEQADDKKQLEEERASLEKKLEEQEESKNKLVNLKASLDKQKASKGTLVDQLEAEQSKLLEQKQVMETEYEEVLNISADVQNKIVAEQKRQAERARKIAEEKKRKAAEERKRQQSSSGSSVAIPEVSSGAWTKPANGTFTSGYGYRIHPIYGKGKMHYGVDFANSTGTPVVSAADGVVSYASPLSTYGNVIMVTHSIDGQTFTSLYAHLSKINVSVGQVVSKGEHIGAIGTTGNSTGPHLHFEIHIGNWEGMTANSVNPLRYISL
ncbi:MULTISPECIES: peptidoglycan DD-metalloendopeptidase family protein [Bacillaceae]|uniref:murein hydrolase activator EnvC family protein n=1 Tax=Bacillaceae TaxID=186817 RepID=UPI0006FF57C3|nr:MULTISPECIES: peptidoglycan DD-metalloendopeptidase family protein [Bacillaceae]KQL36715.1 peptidase M23 [Psychrobacillus sp. FJAT-21963]MDF2065779.1 peptidoglycan DD-metalloendopeptidase family protein [Bacillus sp. Cr_A10]